VLSYNVASPFPTAKLSGGLHRLNEALGAADADLAINRNYALLYAARGASNNWLGRFEQAKSDANERCG
jgi:hypothetical protein